MLNFARQHLWHRCAPDVHQTREDWIIREVLRLPASDVPPDVQIYSAYSCFTLVENPYVNRWNGARAEIISRWVDPPAEVLDDIKIPIEPPKDDHPGPWLLSYVLGYSERAISAMWMVAPNVGEARGCIPLLINSLKVLKDMKLRDDLLTEYHRARYRLLREYLASYYHEIG